MVQLRVPRLTTMFSFQMDRLSQSEMDLQVGSNYGTEPSGGQAQITSFEEQRDVRCNDRYGRRDGSDVRDGHKQPQNVQVSSRTKRHETVEAEVDNEKVKIKIFEDAEWMFCPIPGCGFWTKKPERMSRHKICHVDEVKQSYQCPGTRS